MQLLQSVAAAVPPVDTRLAITYAVNIEIQSHEIGGPSGLCTFAAEIPAPVRAPISRRIVQELLHLAALHGRSPSIEIERGAPSPGNDSQIAIARSVADTSEQERPTASHDWIRCRQMRRQVRGVRQYCRAMNAEQKFVRHFLHRQLIGNSNKCLLREGRDLRRRIIRSKD